MCKGELLGSLAPTDQFPGGPVSGSYYGYTLLLPAVCPVEAVACEVCLSMADMRGGRVF